MAKLSMLDRILLLLTGLLAAYQVVAGIDGKPTMVIVAYTVAFGVLLIAGLLILIIGMEILDSSFVAIVATLIPLSLSLGIVAEHFPEWQTTYLLLVVVGFVLVLATRLLLPGNLATLSLMVVHGISGLLIFGLPFYLSLTGRTPLGFLLVGVGGGLIGLGGLLLSFLKTGHPILSRSMILAVLSGLLVLMTAAFVFGFYLA